jgi:hypothetical protein
MAMTTDSSGRKLFVARTGLATVVLLFGCGSSGNEGQPADGSVTGVVQGRAFRAKAGAFDQMTDLSLLIAVPETDGICQLASSGVSTPAGDMVWLSIYVCAGSVDAVGEYQVEPGGGGQIPCPGKVAWAELRRFLGGTSSLIPVDSGTVTIQTRTGQEVARARWRWRSAATRSPVPSLHRSAQT